MTHNITNQEIKYAIREITREPNEKLITRIQDYFEFYPETLNNLKDDKFKETFIKLLYNYNYLHRELMDRTTETEATGRIILEVLMKENGLNQEEINELLDRNCWRRVTQFSVKREDFAHYGNYKKKKISWKDKEERSLGVEEVISVIENQNQEQIKELVKSNLWLQRELKEEGETHIGAMHFAGELAKAEALAETEKLKTELNDKSETLLDFIDALAKEKVQNEKLQDTVTENQETLKEVNEELATLGRKFYLATKPLPNLPKKRTNLRKLGVKVKTKVCQIAERVKAKTQELVARIEVKAK